MPTYWAPWPGKRKAVEGMLEFPHPQPPLPRRERGRGMVDDPARGVALTPVWLPLSLLGRGGRGVRGLPPPLPPWERGLGGEGKGFASGARDLGDALQFLDDQLVEAGADVVGGH